MKRRIVRPLNSQLSNIDKEITNILKDAWDEGQQIVNQVLQDINSREEFEENYDEIVQELRYLMRDYYVRIGDIYEKFCTTLFYDVDEYYEPDPNLKICQAMQIQASRQLSEFLDILISNLEWYPRLGGGDLAWNEGGPGFTR
jgi:hypothetical protein